MDTFNLILIKVLTLIALFGPQWPWFLFGTLCMIGVLVFFLLWRIRSRMSDISEEVNSNTSESTSLHAAIAKLEAELHLTQKKLRIAQEQLDAVSNKLAIILGDKPSEPVKMPPIENGRLT